MAKIADKTLDFDSKAVDFAFADETTVTIALADFPADIQLHLALHGISQKCGDSYSGAKGDVAAAKKMFDDTLAQLVAGEWRQARGEGESKPRVTELAEAIARIKNVDVEVVKASLDAATDEQRKALRSNDRVKAIIAIIRAEKAQKKLAEMKDDGALDGFGGKAKK